MTVCLSQRLSPLAAAALFALSAPSLSQAAVEAAAASASAPAGTAARTSVVVASAATPQAPQLVVVTGVADKGYDSRISDTATGLGLGRRETPQSISVITRQEMEDFSLTSINQVLSLTPGIDVESVETDRTYYTSRGFDVTNFQVDGIGLPFTGGNLEGDIDTFLYDRIETLRGANGLTSSTGNPSATVNFVRKRPTREFEANAGVTLGSWNTHRVDGDIGGALDETGSVRGRVIVVDESHDSWLKRYSRKTRAFAGLLDVDLAPRTTLEIGYTQQDSDADSPMWGALPLTNKDGSPASYPRSTTSASDWSWWNNTDRRVHVELSHEFDNGWKAKAIATRRHKDSDSELFYVYQDATNGSGLAAYPSAFDGHYGQSMVDLRLEGPFQLFGRRHGASFGVDWARETANEFSGYPDDIGAEVPDLAIWDGSFTKPSFDAFTSGSSWHGVRKSVFAAAHLNLADPLNLVLGANATSVASAGENYGTPHAYSRSAVTPYVGAVYDVSDAVSTYASFTRIFNPQTEQTATDEPLMPIRGSNLEAGVKTGWFGGKLESSFAVFRARQENTATAFGTDTHGNTAYIGENATSTGFEAEISGHLTPTWDVNAGYAQLRIQGDDDAARRLFVPRRTLRGVTSVKVPGIQGLKVGGSLKWQSEITEWSTGASQPAYALLGLMAHYDITPHWSAGVNVDNVTNRKYWTSFYWSQSYYGAPRNVTASLRWTY